MKSYTLALSLLCFIIIVGCSALERGRLISEYEPVLSNASPMDTTVTNVTANCDSRGRQAGLISAFYGLDDALPKAADRGIWPGAGGTDGMPVIFSHEVDYKTMQMGDFRVTTASGKVGEIVAVTLAPADDKGELRTVLFAGSYGSIDDQPVKVEIVGNLLSIDGTLNFKGASVDVTPLEEDPTMVLAEIVPEDEWDIDKEASPLPWGGGSGCATGTKQVVRVTWSGGVPSRVVMKLTMWNEFNTKSLLYLKMVGKSKQPLSHLAIWGMEITIMNLLRCDRYTTICLFPSRLHERSQGGFESRNNDNYSKITNSKNRSRSRDYHCQNVVDYS